MLIKTGIAILLLAILSYLIGMLMTRIVDKENYAISQNIVYGCVTVWGIFQLFVVPAIYAKMSFWMFVITLSAVFLVAAAVSVFLNWSRIRCVGKKIFKRERKWDWLMLLVILVIAAECIFVNKASLGDDDDAFYVATAETAMVTDTLMEVDPYTGDLYQALPSRYVLSPFPLFTAWMAEIFQVKAVVMAHTMLPTILVALAFLVYYLLGSKLVEQKQRSFFMLLCVLLLAFSGVSRYAAGTFMYVRIWQGKAILASILLPLVFWWGIRIFKNEIKPAEWGMVFLTMLSCCMVSSMGIMLGAISLGIIGIVSLIENRSLKQLGAVLICCIPNAAYGLIYLLIR